jgi:membrane fusion protein, multidrug efflux system
MASNEEEAIGRKVSPQDHQHTHSSDPSPDESKRKASESKAGENKDPESANDWEGDKPRSRKPLIIIGAVVVVLAIVGVFVWFVQRNDVTTDDAYTDGNVVTMVPKVAGYVVALTVADNVHIRKGDLLVRIDPRDFGIARQQLAQGMLTQSTDLVKLYKALGGGWQDAAP